MTLSISPLFQNLSNCCHSKFHEKTPHKAVKYTYSMSMWALFSHTNTQTIQQNGDCCPGVATNHGDWFVWFNLLLFLTKFCECVFTADTNARSLQTLKIRCTPLCLHIRKTLSGIIVQNLPKSSYCRKSIKCFREVCIKRRLANIFQSLKFPANKYFRVLL